MKSKESIILTIQEANEIMAILSELPIKYSQIVMTVKQVFDHKFTEMTEEDTTPAMILQNNGGEVS